MTRIIVKSRVGSDGVLHLNLPIGHAEADKEVQVIVEPVVPPLAGELRSMTATDLLHSGLVGIWAGRPDIDANHAFARRLREQAQTRSRDT